MSEVVQELLESLGASVVTLGKDIDRSTSYWKSEPTTAQALLKPRNTQEVSQILAICHKHQQPVVTQGGLTNCVSSAESRPVEVILSLEKMNQIESIDKTACVATVEAGVVLEVLQQQCHDMDLSFPMDLGARGSCTLGGNAATNAGGINVLKYGMIRNLILGLEVVLADGTVLSSLNEMLKNNSGYDLKQLFIGTEGTLGVITKLNLRVFSKPTTKQMALLALESFDAVTQLLEKSRSHFDASLCAYEVMWNDYYSAVTVEGHHRSPMSREHAYYVIIETEGQDQEYEAKRFMDFLEVCLEQQIVVDATLPSSDAQRAQIWNIRENFEAIHEPKPLLLYDVSMPIAVMQQYVDNLKHALNAQWPNIECYVFGHVADGNLHLCIRTNSANAGTLSAEAAHAEHLQVDAVVYNELRAFNGAVSAEHGIGWDKKPWLNHSRSDAEIAMMKLLKQTLDPANILNPGRVFDI